jgi:hypothetical protein
VGDLLHLPNSTAPMPSEAVERVVEDLEVQGEVWEHEPYVSGRHDFTGRLRLPYATVVDWDDLDMIQPGDVILVADDGLTPAATVLELAKI